MPFSQLAALFGGAGGAAAAGGGGEALAGGGGGSGLFSGLFGGGGLQTATQRTGENSGGISGFLNSLVARKNTKANTALLNQQRLVRKKARKMFFGQEGGPFAGLDQGFQDILAELEGFGSGRRASIEQGAKESSRSAQALLQQRGLGSSVLTGNVGLGSERQRQLLLGELDDDVSGLRVGARTQDQQRQLAQQQLLAALLG